MATVSTPRATLDDLYRVEGKAELIGGRIVLFMPSGELPSAVAGEIFVSLHTFAKAKKKGNAYGDGVGYAVRGLPSDRESFSPDVSYFDGKKPRNRMRFINGAPRLGVEVRSKNDYGPAAETDIKAKRDDYFAAGTDVVWDVDPIAETVTVYRRTAPDQSVVYRRGDVAEAEPAVPGWRIAVDEIFDV